jgi:hypothetical protein
MGWLSGFCSGVSKSVSKAVGKAVGGAAEWVGEKTGWTALENAGRKLKEACSETSKQVSETKEYDKQSASINQTINMNEILSGFSIGLQAQADMIERNCVVESQKYFDDLIKALENKDSGIKANRIKSTLNRVKNSINGSFKKHLAKRVSLDNNECLKILQMSAGKEKEKAMHDFGKKVINEALKTLSEQITRIIREQNDEIQEFLEDVLEKQEKELSTMQNQFNSIAIQTENDVLNKEKAKLTPVILIGVTDMVLSNFAE